MSATTRDRDPARAGTTWRGLSFGNTFAAPPTTGRGEWPWLREHRPNVGLRGCR